MAAVLHGWQRSASIREWLLDEPYKFEFYQAVRLIEAFQPLALLPEPAVQARRELVRFRSAVDFEFPASEIQQLEWSGSTPTLTVNFFGLAGALGPLPQPYTEMVMEAVAKKDSAGIDFLDIFNNRLITLLYRARQAHQPALTARPPDQGIAAQYLFSCFGLGSPLLQRGVGFSARSLLQYSGIFSRTVRTVAGLEVLLADYFKVHVQVRQFVAVWREIDCSQWTTLGRWGKNNSLGSEAVLGRRVWDQAGCVLILLGPLDLARFLGFLPGSGRNRLLAALVRFYLGVGRSAKCRMVLKRPDVPQTKLGRSRLGLSTWLLRKPGAKADQEVTFRLDR